MKVLYIHQYFTTPSGSTGTRSYEIAKALVARGHQVTMVCGSGPLQGIAGLTESASGLWQGCVEGIQVKQFQLPYANRDGFVKRTFTFLRFSFRCMGLALREEYDMLYATSTPLTAAFPGIVCRLFRPRKRFVFEVRDLWPELPRAMGVIRNPLVLGGMRALEWMAYRCAHACVGLAPGIVEGIRSGGAGEKKVVLIPNMSQTDFFRTDAAPAQIEGVEDEDVLALFTGAHGIANGLEFLVDVAEVLQKENSAGIHLVLVGDGKCKETLKERTLKLGLENIHFLDPVPKTQMPGLLARADVGLMILADVPAFQRGTSPNKFFDYIAAGLPVVSNVPGWVSEICEEAECGIQIQPTDVKAMAEVLKNLAHNPVKRLDMGQKARHLAESRFSSERLTTGLCEFLEEGVTCSFRFDQENHK